MRRQVRLCMGNKYEHVAAAVAAAVAVVVYITMKRALLHVVVIPARSVANRK